MLYACFDGLQMTGLLIQVLARFYEVRFDFIFDEQQMPTGSAVRNSDVPFPFSLGCLPITAQFVPFVHCGLVYANFFAVFLTKLQDHYLGIFDARLETLI